MLQQCASTLRDRRSIIGAFLFGTSSFNSCKRMRLHTMNDLSDGCRPLGATVCRHTVASEGMSAPVTLEPNEAASLDVGGDGNGVEVMVFNNDGDPIVQVVAQIMDSQGNVVAVWTACGVN